MGKWENNVCDYWSFFGYLYGKYVYIMGLKAPGNYLDQCWSNKILLVLCGRPKHNISMMSGFVSPGGCIFIDSIIPKTLQGTTRKIMGYFLEKYYGWRYENQKMKKMWSCRVPSVLHLGIIVFLSLNVYYFIFKFWCWNFGLGSLGCDLGFGDLKYLKQGKPFAPPATPGF